jgi:hypothetical protein
MNKVNEMGETLKQKCLEYLTSNGMFDNDAVKVFELFAQQDSQKSMLPSWNNDINNFPQMMVRLTLAELRLFTISLIDENQAMEQYKQIFNGE